MRGSAESGWLRPYLHAAGLEAGARSQCTESRTDWLHTAQKRLRASLFLYTARTCCPHLRSRAAHLSRHAPLSSPRYERRASGKKLSSPASHRHRDGPNKTQNVLPSRSRTERIRPYLLDLALMKPQHAITASRKIKVVSHNQG